jgi:SAM-dependent methyltransferase
MLKRVPEYWNHNTAYHRELVAAVAAQHGAVLDVGCGDGLLLHRLVPVCSEAVGIDPDEAAAACAGDVAAEHQNVQILVGDFLTDARISDARFDSITCVAAVHHMPLRPALERIRDLLSPGGQAIVIGLAANKTVLDWVLSGLLVIPVRIMGIVHHETRDIGVATAAPRESLGEIRAIAVSVMPGCRIRRRFYYRYSLIWTKR